MAALIQLFVVILNRNEWYNSLIGFTVRYLNKYYLFQNIYETNNFLVLDSFVFKVKHEPT